MENNDARVQLPVYCNTRGSLCIKWSQLKLGTPLFNLSFASRLPIWGPWGQPLRLDENENETAVWFSFFDFTILITASKNQLNVTPFTFFSVFLPKPTKLPPRFWSKKPKRTKRSKGYQMDKKTIKQRKTDEIAKLCEDTRRSGTQVHSVLDLEVWSERLRV